MVYFSIMCHNPCHILRLQLWFLTRKLHWSIPFHVLQSHGLEIEAYVGTRCRHDDADGSFNFIWGGQLSMSLNWKCTFPYVQGNYQDIMALA